MRRREFITVLGATAGWPLTALAQDRPLPIIGFLSSLSAGALSGPVTAFRAGLQSVGYEDRKNVAIEFRWADGHYDQLPALAADLVRAGAAVIVTVGGDPPAFAAKAATDDPSRIHGRQEPSSAGSGRKPQSARWQCDRYQPTHC